MNPVSYAELLRLTLPQIALTVAAFFVLACDGMLLRRSPIAVRARIAMLLSLAGSLVALALLPLTAPVHLPDGMLVLDARTGVVQVVLLLLTLAVTLLSGSVLVQQGREASAFTTHIGEFFALLLFATVAVLFLVSTQNLLLIFLAVEFLSLVLYVFTAFNKHSRASAEAALKYFLFGGMSAGFLLFGISLLYGISGSLDLQQIALAASQPDSLLLAAIVLVILGFGFKIAAAPFHLWAPDAYQGAPSLSAGFIASSSKVVGFFVFAQVLFIGVASASGNAAWHLSAPGWMPILAAVAVLSMLLGNLAALAQTSLRRLLAYSAIGHAGYLLLGLIAHTPQSLAALLYYVFTYALAVLGAFGVLAVLETNGIDSLSSLAGLSRRSPTLSACLLVFLLSLAGIPPLAGFFAKFWLFAVALQAAPAFGLLWLVILAILMSVVALFYYLRVLRQVYVAPMAENATPLSSPALARITLLVMAALTLLLGCAPNLLMQRLR
uniref:NADH-quinone oxidoreductase subunit N n=1 Tax=Acidobacterium capsulatum TaxID=33075 RepID=A0A7V4XSH0_9BACT